MRRSYLGCREFACDFRLVKPDDPLPDWPELTSAEKRDLGFNQPRDLGWMLHDMDYSNAADPQPRFFRAELKEGVLQVPSWDSKEVRG